MARPLRIEYPGAFYHVINRGLEKREIYKHDKDRVNQWGHDPLIYKIGK